MAKQPSLKKILTGTPAPALQSDLSKEKGEKILNYTYGGTVYRVIKDKNGHVVNYGPTGITPVATPPQPKPPLIPSPLNQIPEPIEGLPPPPGGGYFGPWSNWIPTADGGSQRVRAIHNSSGTQVTQQQQLRTAAETVAATTAGPSGNGGTTETPTIPGPGGHGTNTRPEPKPPARPNSSQAVHPVGGDVDYGDDQEAWSGNSLDETQDQIKRPMRTTHNEAGVVIGHPEDSKPYRLTGPRLENLQSFSYQRGQEAAREHKQDLADARRAQAADENIENAIEQRGPQNVLAGPDWRSQKATATSATSISSEPKLSRVGEFMTTEDRNSALMAGLNPENIVGKKEGKNGRTIFLMANGNMVSVDPETGKHNLAGKNQGLANAWGGSDGGSATAATSTPDSSTSTPSGSGYETDRFKGYTPAKVTSATSTGLEENKKLTAPAPYTGGAGMVVDQKIGVDTNGNAVSYTFYDTGKVFKQVQGHGAYRISSDGTVPGGLPTGFESPGLIGYPVDVTSKKPARPATITSATSTSGGSSDSAKTPTVIPPDLGGPSGAGYETDRFKSTSAAKTPAYTPFSSPSTTPSGSGYEMDRFRLSTNPPAKPKPAKASFTYEHPGVTNPTNPGSPSDTSPPLSGFDPSASAEPPTSSHGATL